MSTIPWRLTLAASGVRGTLSARGANVRVCGRGVLSSELLQEEWIRDETETRNGHRGIIVLCASKGCSFSNVQFKDIEVHGDTLNLLAIDNLDQDTPWSQKVRNVTLREIELVLERVTVTGTERGRWWGPFKDREGQPMRSRLRTADPGRIKVLFEDVSINGVRLEIPVFGQQDAAVRKRLVDDGLIHRPLLFIHHGHHIMPGGSQRPDDQVVATLVGEKPKRGHRRSG